jgi:hypothetical protein
MIHVDAKGDVTLRLNQVGINNPDGPAIYVEKADNAYINVVSDTLNYISDGSEYTTDTAGAAIISNASTYVNGSGSLHVAGNYKNAVYCSKSLSLEQVSITIEAKEYGVMCGDSLMLGSSDANIYSTIGSAVVVENDFNISAGGRRTFSVYS